ncbi:MAG: hypothetical protein U0792_20340 [Gemmataceae bacterium]
MVFVIFTLAAGPCCCSAGQSRRSCAPGLKPQLGEAGDVLPSALLDSWRTSPPRCC